MSRVVSFDSASFVKSNSENRYAGMEIQDFWLRFEGSAQGKNYLVRFLGQPIEYITHYNTKRNQISNKDEKVEFPDSEHNKKFKRNCTDGESEPTRLIRPMTCLKTVAE